MQYGTAYYPEHRSAEGIDQDIRLMNEAGLTVVRLAEFAWYALEPEEGTFEFSWLASVVEQLGASGISSVICTPTASPPVWLTYRYPETTYVDNRGVVRPYGGRRHCCYNNELYRKFCVRVADRLADHFGRHPNVTGFHIDNELAQEGTGRCSCSVCAGAFREWLERRHGSIEAVNESLGTTFWGQAFQDFAQVRPPVTPVEPGATPLLGMFFDNPGLRLAYEQFSSESIVEFQNLQLAAIRARSSLPATTNATGFGTNGVDYFKSFDQLDRYALDVYPDLRGDGMRDAARSYALARGVKDRKFWVVECACGGGHGLWQRQGISQPFPGAVRQEVLHAVASGAELVTHFHFRAFPHGAEQLDPAIIDVDGVPRRRYFEIRDTARDAPALEELLAGAVPVREAAICFDYNSHWAHQIKPIAPDFFYPEYCGEFFDAFTSLGIGCDFISLDNEIADRYRIVVVPAHVVMSDGQRDRLRTFAEDGGTVVATFLTSWKNRDNRAYTQSAPCGLTDLFGIRVTESEPVFERDVPTVSISTGGRQLRSRGRHWFECLETIDATVAGLATDSFRRDTVVCTVRKIDGGAAWYLGTGIEQSGLRSMLRDIAASAGVRDCPVDMQEHMEVLTYEKGDHTHLVVFNFATTDVSVSMRGSPVDPETGEPVAQPITIEAKGTRCLRFNGR